MLSRSRAGGGALASGEHVEATRLYRNMRPSAEGASFLAFTALGVRLRQTRVWNYTARRSLRASRYYSGSTRSTTYLSTGRMPIPSSLRLRLCRSATSFSYAVSSFLPFLLAAEISSESREAEAAGRLPRFLKRLSAAFRLSGDDS